MLWLDESEGVNVNVDAADFLPIIWDVWNWAKANPWIALLFFIAVVGSWMVVRGLRRGRA